MNVTRVIDGRITTDQPAEPKRSPLFVGGHVLMRLTVMDEGYVIVTAPGKPVRRLADGSAQELLAWVEGAL